MTRIVFTDVLVYDADATGGATGPTDVLIEGQRIAAIGSGRLDDGSLHAGPAADASADRIIDGRGHHLLVPGLINAHFHSSANHLKGALPSLPLELFMLYESPSAESLRPTPRQAYLRTMLGAIEMLRGGVTSVADDAFFLPDPEPAVIDAVMSAYADAGIRACLALDQPELPERDKLPPLPTDRVTQRALDAPAALPMAELLERYRHLIDTWHGAADGRLTAAVSVSAPQRVSRRYFEELDALSADHALPIFAHLLETKLQRTLATEQPRFAGRSLVGYTADIGMLSDRVNVIHAVWIDAEDIAMLADSGVTVVHNPVSNLRLGSGVMPFRELRAAGVPIALGVDEAICGDAVDLWSVVRATGLVHNLTGADSATWPSAEEVLGCLWSGGARALRRTGDLGAIRPGQLADLAMVDLHALAFTPLNDLRRQLVYCASGADLVLTMVDGVIVAESGRVTTVDETALLDEAREVFAAQRPALVAAHADSASVRPHYEQLVRRAAAADVGMNRWVGSR